MTDSQRAAGGDAHALVVVTGRAARGEGVTEPEVVLEGDLVGDVGERRGALVGGDDEVRVVLVVAHHVLRRHDLARDQVVGDVEQRRDEGAVAGDALGEPGVTVHGGVRELLGDEAALGADRHDHGVLDHLRLDQAEDLRTEVLTPVGPAQAAARDLAEAQVHALDPRRVHPDLVRRAGRRQVGDGLRVELHRHVVVPLEALRLLEEVGAKGGLDEGEEGPQDPVLVERGDLVQGPVQLLQHGVHELAAGGLAAGRQPRLEEGDQQPGGVDVVAEGVLHVVLAEGGARLAQVLGVRAQDDGLPPVQPGAQHQGVEVVVLRLAGPDGREGLLEALAGVVPEVRVAVRADGRHPQAEVVDPGADPVGAAQFVRALVGDLDAQALEHGQDRGERDLLTGAVDLEPALAGARADGLVQRERERAVAGGEPLQVAEVGDGRARRVVGLVALGEGRAVLAQQLGGALLAEFGDQGLGEAVGPGAGGLDEAALDALDVGVGEDRQVLALRDADDEVDAGEDRLGVPGGEVDADAVELLLEDVHQAQPHAGGEAVARQVDQRGVVAPVLVLAQVQPQPAALLEVQDGGDDLAELVDRGLEQLVARVGLEDLRQVAAVVAGRREAGGFEDLGDLAADHRDAAHGLGVRGGGEQAEEAALADDVALGVELLDAHVVEVRGTVHGGAAVGLGQHQQTVLAGLGAGVGGQPVEGRRDGVAVVLAAVVRVGAQDAEAGAGDGREGVTVDEVVLAVAEEREVVVGEPAQQLAGLFELVLAQVRGGGLVGQAVGDAQRRVAHLLPVLDGLAYVGQDAQQVAGDLLEVGPVGLAVDLDVDPGLDEGVVGARGLGAVRVAVGAEDLDQLAGDVTADDDLRVDHDVDAAALAGQLVGDGVHEEGHVVGDDLDDGVAGGPAVLLDGRRVHAHVRGALRPLLREPVVRERCPEHVDRVPVQQVLGGGVQVVALEVGEHRVLIWTLPLLGPSRK